MAVEEQVDYDDRDVSHFLFKRFLILNRQTNAHTHVEQYRLAVSAFVMVSSALLHGTDFTVVGETFDSAENVFCSAEQNVGALQTFLILKEEGCWNVFP